MALKVHNLSVYGGITVHYTAGLSNTTTAAACHLSHPHLVDVELCSQESITEGSVVILQHFLAPCCLLSQLATLILTVLFLQQNTSLAEIPVTPSSPSG